MKLWVMVVKVLVSALFVVVLLHWVDWRLLGPLLLRVRWEWYLAALLLAAIGSVVNSLKWEWLIQVLLIRMPFRQLFRYYLVGFFFNNILTGVGDAKRIMDVARASGQAVESFISVLMERWTGFVALALFALGALAGARLFHLGHIGIALGPGGVEFTLGQASWIMGAILVALMVLFLFLGSRTPFFFLERIPRLGGVLHSFRHSFSRYRGHPRVLAASIGISLVSVLLFVMVHYLLAIALGISIPLGLFFLFIPIINIFAQMPLSINGVGVQDLGFVILFQAAGIPPAESLSLSILSHLLKISLGVIGGLVYLVSPHDLTVTRALQEEEKLEEVMERY